MSNSSGLVSENSNLALSHVVCGSWLAPPLEFRPLLICRVDSLASEFVIGGSVVLAGMVVVPDGGSAAGAGGPCSGLAMSLTPLGATLAAAASCTRTSSGATAASCAALAGAGAGGCEAPLLPFARSQLTFSASAAGAAKAAGGCCGCFTDSCAGCVGTCSCCDAGNAAGTGCEALAAASGALRQPPMAMLNGELREHGIQSHGGRLGRK